jgi:flagellar biosynthesis/type III secretory pathway protein FliH
MREKESLKIIVNPSIFGLISNTDSLSLEGNKVEIIPDETLSEGDIILISPGGRVEYRLEERFKEIEESFKDVFYSIIQSGKV